MLISNKIKFLFFLLFIFNQSLAQTVDKLRLVFDEKEIVSKQVGATVSDDGKLAAFAYENKVIKVLNLLTGKTIATLKNIHTNVFEIRFNYNATKIISAGDNNSVAIFDLESGKLDNSFTVQNTITKVAIGKINNSIAIGQEKSALVVYNIDAKKEILNITAARHHISALDFHPKLNRIAVANVSLRYSLYFSHKNSVQIYDLESGKVISAFGKGFYSSMEFDKEGNKLFLCGVGKGYPKLKNVIQYYDLSTNKIIPVVASQLRLTNPRYSVINSDEKNIMTIEEGGSFDVVDINSKKLIYTTKNDKYNAAAYTLDFRKFGVGISKIYPLADGKNFLINSFENNICQIYNEETNNISAYLFSDANNDFVTVGRDGRLDGEQTAIAKLYWSERKSNKRTPIENTFDRFYTPDLLAQLIKGVKLEEIKLDIENLKPVPELKFIYPTVGEIEFRSIASTSLVTDVKTLKLEFSATDKGGGLNEIKVYQNGKLVNSSLEQINTLDQSVKKVVNIDLFPGDNAIKIVATNNEKIESASNTVVKYSGTSNEPAKLFVLAIGINKYQKSSYDLNFAVPDATGFTEALNIAAKDLFAEVNITLIQDGNATKQNILKAVEKIKPLVKQGDVFVFYYAGHGAMTIAAQGEQSVFNLVPNDVTNFYNTEMLKERGISTSELQKISKDINAQKQLFIIDACQSGGAVDALASRGALNEKEIATLARSTGTYFLTASGSDQLAGEFAALGHGVFTYAILQAFTGKADAQNGDSKISVKELSLFLENAVPDLSEKYKGQRQFPESYGYGQDFLLVMSNKYKMKDLGDVKVGKYAAYSLEDLRKLKEAAVAKEDYDTAKEIKIEIEKRSN